MHKGKTAGACAVEPIARGRRADGDRAFRSHWRRIFTSKGIVPGYFVAVRLWHPNCLPANGRGERRCARKDAFDCLAYCADKSEEVPTEKCGAISQLR